VNNGEEGKEGIVTRQGRGMKELKSLTSPEHRLIKERKQQITKHPVLTDNVRTWCGISLPINTQHPNWPLCEIPKNVYNLLPTSLSDASFAP